MSLMTAIEVGASGLTAGAEVGSDGREPGERQRTQPAVWNLRRRMFFRHPPETTFGAAFDDAVGGSKFQIS
jgi:hypothetical protein